MAPTLSVEDIRAIAEAVGITQKNNPASTTVTAPTLQGPFPGNTSQLGPFSAYGPRPERFSALVRPRSLARLLALNSSVYHEEILEIMTGVTAAAGTNATGFCGDPPTVGQGKVCEQIYKWGRYMVKTDLEAIPEIGTLRSRFEVPGEILNSGPTANPLVPDILYRMVDTRSPLQYGLWRIGVQLERVLGPVLVLGDTTLNSTQTHHGFISEFKGLDGMIKTGYVDAATSIACPAADSAVLNFNTSVSGTIGGGDGRNITIAVSDVVWALKDRAVEMGMDTTQFAIVMRKELFRSIVEVWACQYATYRCQSSATGTDFVNDVRDSNALRLEMMNGQYLLIDNVPVPVVFEEGIPQESLGSNQFKSDMYIVPVSWEGMPLVRLEYFPMDNQYIQEFSSFVGSDQIGVINNGLYIVGNRHNGFCKEYLFGSKMRLILETPFLAGRVDDIAYTFRAPIRNSNPSDSFFYADGGLTYRS